MRRLFLLLIVLASCNFANDKPSSLSTDEEGSKETYVLYRSNPGDLVGSGIKLYPDSTYSYGFGACLDSGSDSGRYKINGDTISFQSFLERMVDTSNHGHNQICPLTGRVFLIREGRVYYRLDNKSYNMSVYWLKEGLKTKIKDVLDSCGNGYARLYNGEGQWVMSGLFKKYQLIDGKRYYYLQNDRMSKIEIYKEGIKIKDSIPL